MVFNIPEVRLPKISAVVGYPQNLYFKI